jgi:hypothetical protein
MMMFQTHLLLSIGLTLKVIVAEDTESTTANNEEETTMKPRSGVVSNIVGGLLKPLDVVLPQRTKAVIAAPIQDVAEVLDSRLKAIYPGEVCKWCRGDLINIFIHCSQFN